MSSNPDDSNVTVEESKEPEETKGAKALNRIDQKSILQICSNQVITDLKGAIKELVENSIDANARTIEIKFIQYGLDGIEVADDGKGIHEGDYEIVCKRGTTSKISELDDIYRIKSLGFRGEALSSLCSVSELSISTKRDEESFGHVLNFNESGDMIKKTQIARNTGTTVSIKNLFRKLPVRYNEFKKTCKNQFNKALASLQSYAIINCHIKFIITSIVPSTKTTNIMLKTNGDNNLKENIVTIMGRKKTQQLIEFNCELPHCKIDGFITKYISSGSLTLSKINKDGIHCFLNMRPVDLPKKIIACFIDIYRQFSAQVMPVIVLNFTVEDEYYDINVTPDKREVFIKNESEIITELKIKLNDFFEEIQKSKLVQNLKKKEDGFNPQLTEEENEIIRSLQKKKVVHKVDEMSYDEEEEFKNRKETGLQKAMSNYTEKFSQYKETLKKKRKAEDVEKESQEISDKLSDSQCKFKPEVHTVKRMKTDYELECQSDEGEGEGEDSQEDQEEPTENIEEKEAEKSNIEESKEDFSSKRPSISSVSSINKSITNINLRKKELTAQLEDRTKRMKKIDPLAQQQKQKDFLSKFQAASKRICKTKQKTEDEVKDEIVEKPKDYNSAINRTFTPQNVKYLDKENDPAYEMNQDLLNYTNNKMNSFKKQKIEIVNKSQVVDSSLRPIYEENIEIDITKEAKNNANVSVEHPMNSERLVFMDRLPITTNLDNEDSEVNLDITMLPMKIEREKKRYREALQKRKEKEQIEDHSTSKNKVKTNKLSTGSMDNNITEVGEDKLKEMFGKEDFKRLKIIGQFNLGFILAVKADTNQLFIMDQHATDEKCTFERLSQTTVIHSQRLINPIVTDVNVCELLALKEHKEIFEKNGFYFEFVTEENSNCTGNRIRLLTLPFSKKITFNVDDFNQLLSRVSEDIDNHDKEKEDKKFLHKEIFRPPRIKRMIANRACRNSIIVGRALDKRQMRDIARNLSGLDCPWNCPHGRPTMRFLLNLNDIPNSFEEFGDPPKIMGFLLYYNILIKYYNYYINNINNDSLKF